MIKLLIDIVFVFFVLIFSMGVVDNFLKKPDVSLLIAIIITFIAYKVFRGKKKDSSKSANIVAFRGESSNKDRSKSDSGNRCIYCNKKVGMFKKFHRECRDKHYSGLEKLEIIGYEVTLDNSNIEERKKEVEKIKEESFISDYGVKKRILIGFSRALDEFLEDNILSDEEESKLQKVIDAFSLNELSDSDSYFRYVKALILKSILNGKIPKNIKIESNIPFNLQKSEHLIWVFNGVDYYENKKRIQYVGGSQGVSIRIAKGIYYRVGAYKGERVESQETILKGSNGVMAITNKHIYYTGGDTSFRVKYDKIVSFIPYENGIAIIKDSSNAKPQIFITNDGWFTYNLITNIPKAID